MAYVGVAKALYDYEAQNPEDELSFKEEQLLYIVEKDDDEWWKAKVKDEGGADGPVGLIPCTYVEELSPMHQARSIYAYDSTSPEELTMDADVDLHVYAEEDEWVLVSIGGTEDKLGFVPRNYCEPLDDDDAEGAGGGGVSPVAAGAAAAGGLAAGAAAAAAADERARAAAQQRELAAKDKVESWSISELDGKKKKKGSLSVGNGTIFFASESDKSPIQQYPISDLTHVEQEGSKVIALTLDSLPTPLRFNTGSSKTTQAIVDKLASSKQVAGEVLDVAADRGAESSGEEDNVPPPTLAPPALAPPASIRRVSEPKTVRFTEPDSPISPVTPAAPQANGGAETCLVLYDFDAKGEDELNVEENERLTVVDRSDDEWWLVRNARGQEGVIPAQYVELEAGGGATNGSAPSPPRANDDERRREAEVKAQVAAAAAAADRQRKEDAARNAARRDAERAERESAAHERAEQEALDRELAEQIEAEEREKRRGAEERAKEQQDFDNMRRRQAARRMGDSTPTPPEVTRRRSVDPQAQSRDIPSPRERAAAPRPDARPKPNPSRVRTWSDRTGQFNVEAEFLGLNGNKLRLHKTNGVIIEVPLEKMSSEDMNIIKRYQARKKERERSSTADDEDTPLGWSHPPRRPSQQMSQESSTRTQQQALAVQKTGGNRKPKFDWFSFFLEAGCDMDDCTRYGANFDRDRIDETILTDLDTPTMRSLGLREGDVIRVRKHIQVKYGKKTPEVQAQLSEDEELARKLQEQESKGSPAPAPPALFTSGPGGKLANNTRRGRPERRGTLTDTVDPNALAAASDQLAKVSLMPLEPSKPATPPIVMSPPPEEKEEKPKSGFDDDDGAWAIKPVTKVASPAPPVATPSPAPPANGTDALLAQISGMRPASTGPPPGGADFEQIAAANAAIPQRTGSIGPPSSYGLGAASTSTPMGQLAARPQLAPPVAAAPPPQPQMNPNAPRGPLAPVPLNQGLLNPMQPHATGMFVPTHPTGMSAQSPFAGGVPAGQYLSAGGMQPMVTGVQPMMQPMYTGFQQPQQQSTFNAIANIPPPQPQQPQTSGGGGDKFAPTNIFSAMKRTDYGKREEENPQPSMKYDALRPLTTGYNGAPGMYPQATGMGGMGMQPTGMGGMGMQPTGMMQPQMGMGMQPTGMMMQPGQQMGMQGQPGQQGMYPGSGMYMGQGYGY